MDHRTSEDMSAASGQASPPMLDLQRFCGNQFGREYLHKPFSRNGFTYATNGHIMVRVALRPDVPDVDKKFNQERPLEGIETATFYRPSFELPAMPTEVGECLSCDGSGHEHTCPHCTCRCESCGGSGEENPEKRRSATIGVKIFAMNYIRQMLSLPGIELAVMESEPDEKPLLFRFDGGVGALMPMRSKCVDHVDIKPSKDPAIT
jgi:hypothetical protein